MQMRLSDTPNADTANGFSANGVSAHGDARGVNGVNGGMVGKVAMVDTTGDGFADSVGYDTTGDGKVSLRMA